MTTWIGTVHTDNTATILALLVAENDALKNIETHVNNEHGVSSIYISDEDADSFDSSALSEFRGFCHGCDAVLQSMKPSPEIEQGTR